MKIRVLYFDGCPNHKPTVTLLSEVAAASGVTADIEQVKLTDPTDVERLRFLGSPTVQIEGRDIEPDARTRTDFAFACRMYGTSGTPSRELVRAAIAEARAA